MGLIPLLVLRIIRITICLLPSYHDLILLLVSRIMRITTQMDDSFNMIDNKKYIPLKRIWFLLFFLCLGLSINYFVHAIELVHVAGPEYIANLVMAFSNAALCVVFYEMSFELIKKHSRLIAFITLVYSTFLFDFLVYYLIKHGFDSGELLFKQIISLFFFLSIVILMFHRMRGKELPRSMFSLSRRK